MRYQRKATNSPATSKPRNSNDSHRPSPPDTTQMRQALDLNRKPAGDIRFSPTTISSTDQTPTPPSTRNPGTKPFPYTPRPHGPPKTNPQHGPNRKSATEPGISPWNTTGQGPPTRQASSTTRTKPRNSNDSHRSSLPRTTRIWQAPGLNREPAGETRFSPTAPPNTDQPSTPPSTRNPRTKPITLHHPAARTPKPTRCTDQIRDQT